jgi:hypothetical protein
MSDAETPRQSPASSHEPYRNPDPPKIRTRCTDCGAHMMVRIDEWGFLGRCMVCGGFELVPLEPDV